MASSICAEVALPGPQARRVARGLGELGDARQPRSKGEWAPLTCECCLMYFAVCMQWHMRQHHPAATWALPACSLSKPECRTCSSGRSRPSADLTPSGRAHNGAVHDIHGIHATPGNGQAQQAQAEQKPRRSRRRPQPAACLQRQGQETSPLTTMCHGQSVKLLCLPTRSYGNEAQRAKNNKNTK